MRDAIRRAIMTIQVNTAETTNSTTTDRAILLVVCLVALLGLVAVATMTG
jgi:CHASE3 domain sensor protein